jgi:hypothetical protein
MKNFLPFLALIMLICWSACETDFTLEGEWKDIPVVYSFLSEQDTAHYIRVERAFLEPGGNAVDIAQIPDSIFYQPGQIAVILKNGNDIVELSRVDGNLEGYPRQDGSFASSPNVLYKASKSAVDLQGGDQFQVMIMRDGEITAEAQSVVVDKLDFSQIPPNGLSVGSYGTNSAIAFLPEGDEAAVFDIRLIFRYNETDPNNPSNRLSKEVVWVLDDAYRRSSETSTQRFVFLGESFYQFLDSAIDPISNGNRQFEEIFFEVTAAGSEIAEYLDIANANIGITSAQAVPVYSNVDGGVGIVSSRYTARSASISLNTQSRDSLLNGIYTRDLRFVP